MQRGRGRSLVALLTEDALRNRVCRSPEIATAAIFDFWRAW
jgi:hypothetical protein